MNEPVVHCIKRNKSTVIGSETGVYLKAERNTILGHGSGFNTRSSNNIIIGVGLDSLKSSQIKIGGKEHIKVLIGAYDLEKMFIEFQEMKKRLNELEHDVYKPEGINYKQLHKKFNKDKEKLNKEKLKDCSLK